MVVTILSSYEAMGTAALACLRGCTRETQLIDASRDAEYTDRYASTWEIRDVAAYVHRAGQADGPSEATANSKRGNAAEGASRGLVALASDARHDRHVRHAPRTHCRASAFVPSDCDCCERYVVWRAYTFKIASFRVVAL